MRRLIVGSGICSEAHQRVSVSHKWDGTGLIGKQSVVIAYNFSVLGFRARFQSSKEKREEHVCISKWTELFIGAVSVGCVW